MYYEITLILITYYFKLYLFFNYKCHSLIILFQIQPNQYQYINIYN